MRFVFIDGERLRFCPRDHSRGLGEYRLRAVERDLREREREVSEPLDRDLLRLHFALLQRERLRLRLRLLLLEPESGSESEFEERAALSKSK